MSKRYGRMPVDRLVADEKAPPRRAQCDHCGGETKNFVRVDSGAIWAKLPCDSCEEETYRKFAGTAFD